ncbi:MAG: SLBB domain-containing protein [Myxococcota bacterium]
MASLPALPVMPEDDADFDPVDAAPLPGMPNDPPAPMMLRPGDVVTLRLDSADTLEVPLLTVDARGVLHVPLAGDVEVARVDLTEAERRIEQAFEPYDRTVRATLVLTAPDGQQATVLGAVNAPGRYAVIPGTRLADLVAMAGGTATTDQDDIAVPTADLLSARLVRDGEALPVNVARAIEGDAQHNVNVIPGDHLYIPPHFDTLVSVIGEVNGAGTFPFRPGLRLTRALAFAGGPTADGDKQDIIVVRGNHAAPQVYRARLGDLLDGDAADPLLAPGDVVYVAPTRLARTRDVMAVVAPIISLGLTAAFTTLIFRGDDGGGAAGL